MRDGYLRQVLIWILMVQIALPAPLVMAAQATTSHPAPSLVGQQPLLTFLEGDRSLAQIPGLDRQDPALDQDPFFLRAQQWVDALAEPINGDDDDGPLFTTTPQGFIIQAAGAKKALAVNVPLRPMGFTDEYIFLAAQPHARLFEAKSLPSEISDPTGQGIFILSYQHLLQGQHSRSTVPIYFFPLPGSHWNDTNVEAHEFPRQNTVVVADGQGFTLPLALDDIAQVIAVEDLNLTMALTEGLQKSMPALLAQPHLQRSAAALEDLFQTTKFKIQTANQSLSAQQGTELMESMTKEFLVVAGQMTSALSAQAAYPLRGSTAGFGIFFTGHDLDTDPGAPGANEKNLWSQHRSLQRTFGALLNQIYRAVSPPSAHAIGLLVEQVPLAAQILRFAAISGIAVIASVVMKYTVFHKRFQEKTACETALLNSPQAPTPPKGRIARFFQGIGRQLGKVPVLRTVGREVRDIGTVTAHTLTTISQFPSVWFGNLVEFAGDRLAPRYFAGENKLIRRFLEKTVYFVRDVSERLPVSAYTWVMGALVYGGIDTVNYYVQLYHTVPAIAFGIAASLPMLRSRIDEAFAVGNPHTGAINQYEIVRCATYYGNAGASVYSQSWRTQLLSGVTKEVEEEMLAQNLNPREARNQSERERRIQSKLEEVMHQQGLPGSEEFLYDASTLYGGVMRILGYQIPHTINTAHGEEQITSNDIAMASPPRDLTEPGINNASAHNGNTAQDSFWGQERPGLIVPSVTEALKQARLQLERTPENTKLHSAISMLSELQANLSVLKTFAGQPAESFFIHNGSISEKFRVAWQHLKEYGQRFRKVRQELMALTYEAGIHDPLRHVPLSWKQRLQEFYGDDLANEGANLAAQYFRQAYLAFLTGDNTVLGPTTDQRNQFKDRALRYADAELKQRHQIELSRLEKQFYATEATALTQLKTKYNIEYDSILDEQIVEFVKDAQALATNTINTTYKPQKKGVVARWQERRAFRKAQERYLKEFGEPFDMSHATAEVQTRWNQMYAQALMNTIGLYPDYAENSELKNQLDALSSEMTLNQIQSDSELAAYINQLEPAPRAHFTATLFADNAVKNYLAATVSNVKMNSISTLQPGRLQWLRKTKFFKNSQALTRIARGAETLVSNNSYELGLKSLLNRNLPMYQDMSQSNNRAYRSAITNGTATYQFNAHVYGIHLSPAMWTLNLVSRFLVGGPEQTVNRAFRMQGLQPMGKVHTMVAFAFVFSWATFWGTIPIQIFAGDFNTAWQAASQAVSGPMHMIAAWLRGLGQ